MKKLWLRTTEKAITVPENEALIPLSSNTSISYLDLTGIHCNVSCLNAFAIDMSVQELVWNGVQLDDLGAQTLAGNSKLIKLDLRSNNISDGGALALSQNQSLKMLQVQSNRIGTVGLNALQSNNTIAYLYDNLQRK